MKHGPEDDIIHLAPRKWVPRGKTKSENFDKCQLLGDYPTKNMVEKRNEWHMP